MASTTGSRPIRFDDADAYERMMGVWSRLAGDVFLDWLEPGKDLRWIDIGCGNGAFTELIVRRCGPRTVHGVDPSVAQIAFARERKSTRAAFFETGDALALPFDAASFDAAVMALVIFFVRDPVQAVAEMVRVVAPGGVVAAYVWDVVRNGSPIDPIREQMMKLGIAPVQAPSAHASRPEALRDLWSGTGLLGIETTQITVQRTFADFDDFWNTTIPGTILNPLVEALDAADLRRLQQRVRDALPADASGRITYPARANAVKGYTPLARNP